MKKITIGVIGCGRIADCAHFPAFSNLQDLVRVKYACDILPEKAEAAKKKFPFVEQAVADYREVLADSEVDAVYVLTPNYVHYTVTMDALRAGKHVFCEKPVTVDYAKSKEMADTAKKAGKLLNIGVCNRYQKSVEMLEEYNRNGGFGELYHVYCSFRSCRSIPGLGGAFTTKALSGGGVLIDWGVHFLDLILYILGAPALKNATCDSYSKLATNLSSYRYHHMWAEDTADFKNGTNDVEEMISGYIRTEKGNISFNGAWAQNLDKNEMFIDFLGSKGGARLTYCGKIEFFNGETLETTKPEYDIPDMYTAEDRAFLEATRTGEKTRSYIDRILPTMQLLQGLYDSAKERKEIDF